VTHSIERSAELLFQARCDARPLDQEELGIEDLRQGEAVQARLLERSKAAGRRAVGWKIGLTSPAAMSAFGASEPMVGRIFEDSLLPSGGQLDPAITCTPKIEGELLIELGERPDADCEASILLASIRSVRPAMEVADSRIAGWPKGVAAAVADNACCGWIVMAPEGQTGDLDLAVLEMELAGNGEVVSRGSGESCMGGPLTVYRWFLQKAAASGWELRPGEWLLTGAMGPPVTMQPGTRYCLTMEKLGSVGLGFGTEDRL
jgi:2-keto-4-pentenoate hydratase